MLADLEAAIAPGGFADMTQRSYDEAAKDPTNGLFGGNSWPETRKTVRNVPGGQLQWDWEGGNAGPPKADLQEGVLRGVTVFGALTRREGRAGWCL